MKISKEVNAHEFSLKKAILLMILIIKFILSCEGNYVRLVKVM